MDGIKGQIAEKTVSIVAAEPIVTGANTFYTEYGVLLIALKANINTVFVGNSTVTAVTGFPLNGGDALIVPCRDASNIYVIATVVGQKVRAIGV